MGHEPNRKARKRRAGPKLADTLRKNSENEPARRKAEAKKKAAENVEKAYRAIRQRALEYSKSSAIKNTSAIVAYNDLTVAFNLVTYESMLDRIAERLREDGLKVSYEKLSVQESQSLSWRFSVAW